MDVYNFLVWSLAAVNVGELCFGLHSMGHESAWMARNQFTVSCGELGIGLLLVFSIFEKAGWALWFCNLRGAFLGRSPASGGGCGLACYSWICTLHNVLSVGRFVLSAFNGAKALSFSGVALFHVGDRYEGDWHDAPSCVLAHRLGPSATNHFNAHCCDRCC